MITIPICCVCAKFLPEDDSYSGVPITPWLRPDGHRNYCCAACFDGPVMDARLAEYEDGDEDKLDWLLLEEFEKLNVDDIVHKALQYVRYHGDLDRAIDMATSYVAMKAGLREVDSFLDMASNSVRRRVNELRIDNEVEDPVTGNIVKVTSK